MSKKKKIFISIIAVILLPAMFFAGYWARSAGFDISNIWSSDKASFDSSPEDETPLTDPYLKEGAVYNGSFREMLSDEAKQIYDAMKKHFYEERRFDELKIDKFSSRTDQHMIDIAWCALCYDCPEIFWVLPDDGHNEFIRNNDKLESVVLHYFESYTGSYYDIDKVFSGMDGAVAAIKSTRKSESRYDTLKAINSYICHNSGYDTAFMNDGVDTVECTTLAPLFGGGNNDRKLICCGYAKALKGLCNRFDIPCVIINGFVGAEVQGEVASNVGHTWNYVQMEDGKWYVMDVTWNNADHPLYFLIGSQSELMSGRTKEKGVGFTVGGDVVTRERIMTYPELSEEDYKH